MSGFYEVKLESSPLAISADMGQPIEIISWNNKRCQRKISVTARLTRLDF